MEVKNRVNLEITASAEDLKAIATDMCSFEESNGNIIINFLQTYGEKIDEDGNINKKGQVVSRVMLSWDNFAELLPRIADFAKTMQAKADRKHNNALAIMSGVTSTGESRDGK